MTSILEIPYPPPHHPESSSRLEPPLVSVEPRWEYRVIVRESADLPSEAELNSLGNERWELAGVTTAGSRVHFYFKRERPG
jgi:hypothetical protein